MIGRLSGKLLAKKNTMVLIDVQGVGYECQIPFSDTLLLGALGSPLVLWTHVQIKEDAHELYGFLSQSARQFFRLLIKISGVGPKMALTILSGVELSSFIQAIERQDAQCLTSLPGIGQKTAERLMLELRDKFKKNPSEWQALAAQQSALNDMSGPSSTETQPASEPDLILESPEVASTNKKQSDKAANNEESRAKVIEAMQDATSALINLGYKPPDAHQAIARAFQHLNQGNASQKISNETLIREALKSFSPT